MVSTRYKKAVRTKKPRDKASRSTTSTKGHEKGATKTQQKGGLRLLQQKWGPDLIAAGWVALPSIILERQDALGLDAIDVNVILHIAKHWFEPGNLPHPSKGSIAKAMQVTPRTIQKRFSRLDALGFVQRIERRGPKGTKGSQTSKFDFSGLTKEATPFAIEALQERKRKREEKLARLGRKRPKIEADVDDPDRDREDGEIP
jgi:DNA-binding transcriptional regulator YhcF (GntR family)